MAWQNIKYVVLLAAVMLFFTACNEVSYVEELGIYQNGNAVTLVLEENAFVMPNRSKKDGITTATGFARHYIRTLDVPGGKVIASKKIPGGDDQVTYLGTAGNRAWFWSKDSAIGLHTRNIQQLNIEKTYLDILKQNKLNLRRMNNKKPGFVTDSSGKNIYVKTIDGSDVLINPFSLSVATAINSGTGVFYQRYTNSLMEGGELNDSLYISFEGKGIKQLWVSHRAFDKEGYDLYTRSGRVPDKNLYYRLLGLHKYPELSYIEPAFIADNKKWMGSLTEKPVLYTTHQQMYVLSRSAKETDFTWVVNSIYVNADTAYQKWKFNLNSIDPGIETCRFIRAFEINGLFIAAFENIIIALKANNGELVWQKSFGENH